MKLLIPFYPDVTKHDLESGGVCSEIGWQQMSTHLDKIFHIKEDKERLIGIEVTENGIKARIESIPKSAVNKN